MKKKEMNVLSDKPSNVEVSDSPDMKTQESAGESKDLGIIISSGSEKMKEEVQQSANGGAKQSVEVISTKDIEITGRILAIEGGNLKNLPDMPVIAVIPHQAEPAVAITNKDGIYHFTIPNPCKLPSKVLFVTSHRQANGEAPSYWELLTDKEFEINLLHSLSDDVVIMPDSIYQEALNETLSERAQKDMDTALSLPDGRIAKALAGIHSAATNLKTSVDLIDQKLASLSGDIGSQAKSLSGIETKGILIREKVTPVIKPPKGYVENFLKSKIDHQWTNAETIILNALDELTSIIQQDGPKKFLTENLNSLTRTKERTLTQLNKYLHQLDDNNTVEILATAKEYHKKQSQTALNFVDGIARAAQNKGHDFTLTAMERDDYETASDSLFNLWTNLGNYLP